MPIRTPATTTTTPQTPGPASTASATATLSFAALAKARAEPLLAEIVADAAKLQPGMMPHEPECKALRKKVARLRDVLDIFVHAWGGPQERTWKRVRDRVDVGYESLGHFKDLFDSQELTLKGSDPQKPNDGVAPADVKYDARILKNRRDTVLTWKREFLDPQNLAEMQKLVANPASTPQHVDEKNLTRFFWGAVSIEPDGAKTGLANAKDLGGALVDEAKDALAQLINAPSVRGDANETAFHDVRKRLRSIANLAAAFPEIVDDAGKADPLLKSVTSFVSSFGDVEDRLVAMHITMEERDAQALPGKQKVVDDSWVALKQEIGAKKLAQTLASLGALI